MRCLSRKALESYRTSIQVPEANAIAERFVRTARSECLDWLLIMNAGHLERALQVFFDHYNGHRAHRRLGLAPPNRRAARAVVRHARDCGETPRSAWRARSRIRAGGVTQSICAPYTLALK